MDELVERLKMPNAAQRMNTLGRWLVDAEPLTIWERDTRLLSRAGRKWRRRALEFSRRFIRPVAVEADLHHHEFDRRAFINKAAKRGFLSLLMPAPFGRANLRAYLRSTIFQVILIAEEFCTESGGIGLLLLVHYLGIAPILLSGHFPSYIRHLIPLQLKSMTDNPTLMAFAITEPSAGSDVEETEGGATARLVTTAKKTTGGYLLNGRKVFISNGQLADKITVFAKLGGEALDSWTCFLVDKKMDGFSVGRQERKMGQRPSDASEIILEDVFVPNKNIIGKLRGGWALNRNVLNYSRPAIGAMAVGMARGAFEKTLHFCRETFLGDKRLIDYQDVQLELADMFTQLWAARSMVWHSCRTLRSNQAAAAATKVFATDTAYAVCNKAMDLMGDHSYIRTGGVERALRDVRLTQIYEGTNQINRLALIEQQWEAEIEGSEE
ncbi:MAG TPA: acyl-CoA dehydrogenase [Caldithrix abyssi]|uniref:Acyl-CoA dehydrogenase n=1 Tax=Caldithrix abyssi TaxID=187145 RepID=A0A7V4U1F4_CALAY|nr:acyl-CoA dehydrogenase [Caldithrix abyssi]